MPAWADPGGQASTARGQAKGCFCALIPLLSHSLGCGFAQEHGRRREPRSNTRSHWSQPHRTLIPWRRQNKMGPLEVWLLASAANGGWSFGLLKPPRLSVSRPSVPRRLLAHPIQNLPHSHRRRRGCPSRQCGGDCAPNAVVFGPDQKPRLVRTGKRGLVDPCSERRCAKQCCVRRLRAKT